jgi:hypothetical protein
LLGADGAVRIYCVLRAGRRRCVSSEWASFAGPGAVAPSWVVWARESMLGVIAAVLPHAVAVGKIGRQSEVSADCEARVLPDFSTS